MDAHPDLRGSDSFRHLVLDANLYSVDGEFQEPSGSAANSKHVAAAARNRFQEFPNRVVRLYRTPATLGLEQGFYNSLMLVIPATIISCFIGSINGYVLSKWKFRGADFLFTLMLFGMFLPYQSILIPLVVTYQNFARLTGIQLFATIPGLVVAHVIYGIPICTLIFRNYYAQIPTEMIEAARIDGANFFSIYRRILLPLSQPAFVVVVIWQFTSIWNDFLFGITLANTPKVYPITVSLNNIAGSFHVPYNVQMAAALLTALPPLLCYIILGRYFIRGLMAGSLKG